MNSETSVIAISPKKRSAGRRHGVLPHSSIGGQQPDLPEYQQPDLPEYMPKKPDLDQLLRELLDESHKQIRLLEAQIKRMRSALIKAKLGE